MSAAEWARFDAAFDAALDGCSLAEPLRYYQSTGVGGLPPPRREHTLNDDTRRWPSFVRATLVDGRIVRDTLIAPQGVSFVRPASECMGVVMPAGTPGAKHVAEPGRYHLFVSGVCPWASSCRAARHLLGLEGVISMEVADGQSDRGWVLLGGTCCTPWAGRAGPFFLHEVYQHAEPCGTARITMPVLWDKREQTIVSNDSWSIVKMLGTVFAPLGTPPYGPVDLVPSALAEQMETAHKEIYDGLLNRVYVAGIMRKKQNLDGAAAAARTVYATLDSLEESLQKRRHLLGTAQPTAVDLRLTMTLLRYDIAYRPAFGLGGGRGGILAGDAPGAPSGYPTLAAYARDMYRLLEPCTDWPAVLQYYRWAPYPPERPVPDFHHIVTAAKAPHGRQKLH